MVRPRHLLLAMTAAMTLLGSALAEGNPATEPVAGFLSGSSITCSTAWPSSTTGCWWEKRVLVLGAVELAVGVDAQAVLTGGLNDAHLAPYVILAAYLDAWSAWAELRLPELSGVPVLGSPDWLRVGMTYHWAP